MDGVSRRLSRRDLTAGMVDDSMSRRCHLFDARKLSRLQRRRLGHLPTRAPECLHHKQVKKAVTAVSDRFDKRQRAAMVVWKLVFCVASGVDMPRFVQDAREAHWREFYVLGTSCESPLH